MSQPRVHHIHCPDTGAGHRMAYWQWGEQDAPHVVLCVHGLTRQGRDFDVLARALVSQGDKAGHPVRVVCPDVAGRGQSQWLADPALYQPLTYLADMQHLLRQLHAQAPVLTFDWVGTSMGGLVGMLAGVQPQNWPVPIRRLVLNDVGPELNWAGLERIRGYVGQGGPFQSIEQGLEALRQLLAGFGPHTPEQWRELNAAMFRPAPAADGQTPHGAWLLHYDPAIAAPLQALNEEGHHRASEVMRGLYEQIRCETLLLRGAQSELLTHDAALAMTQTGPRARLVEFEGVGHAPTLVAAGQVQVVQDFLFG